LGSLTAVDEVDAVDAVELVVVALSSARALGINESVTAMSVIVSIRELVTEESPE